MPQAILVLGGGHQRERAAAKLATHQPGLEVWLSSGLLPPQAKKIFLTENISLSRVHLDYRATDTVTNFTTLVAELEDKEIHHVYLVTSDFHMRRSTAIAFWILGSHGIAYTPVPVKSNEQPEPIHKTLRDITRSWLWLLTGRTGSSLDPNPPAKPKKISSSPATKATNNIPQSRPHQTIATR
ncbi:YdcF family protein [Leptothoe kymatousa]|nr:YdcF family protein [Leptothoe kymatousa]